MLTLFLSKALLCSAIQCWPVLIGKDTPTGSFKLTLRLTEAPGYSGSVLQFHETEEYVFAIHRVWNGRPKERRNERLQNLLPSVRTVTKGCVNVSPEVYEHLVKEHQNDTLLIQ